MTREQILNIAEMNVHYLMQQDQLVERVADLLEFYINHVENEDGR